MNTLIELLESSVERFGPTPALLIKPALRYRVWTYGDMWRDAGKVASFLQARGIEKGDKVLLWGPNTPNWVLAFFGVLRAGAIGVPLDVRSNQDFVARVVESTEPKLAFVSRFTSEQADLGIDQVSLEDLESTIAGYSPEPAEVTVESSDLAEIMFTSGTTGDPKGVMLSHGNIASNTVAVSLAFPAKSTDRMLSVLPLSHMFEQTGGLFVPLSQGLRIVYPTSRQPTFIFKALRETGITIFLLVPQGLQLFMDGIEREVERRKKGGIWRTLNRITPFLPVMARRVIFANVHKQMGGKIRFALSGGARLEPALARKWENLGVRVLEGYGTTEASPVISFSSLDHNVPGSVGRGGKTACNRWLPVDSATDSLQPNCNASAVRHAIHRAMFMTSSLGLLTTGTGITLRHPDPPEAAIPVEDVVARDAYHHRKCACAGELRPQ